MARLNTIEKLKLVRRIARLKEGVEKLEDILAGQPIGTVRFANAVITAAKIASLSADKITSGTISVGEQILVSDGSNVRILIDRENLIVSKAGFDANVTITEANKKNFVVINYIETHKLIYADFVEATSYTHNLGYVPWAYVFEVDSVSNPTYFQPVANDPFSARATTTQVTNLPNPCYLMLYHRN